MDWPTDSMVLEYAGRLTAAFALALVLSKALAKDVRLRRFLWPVCFAVPFLLLLPLPSIDIPILKRDEAPMAPSSRVFELDPGFSNRTLSYLDDRPPGPVLIFVLAAACLGLAVLVVRWIATQKLVRGAEQVTDEDLIGHLYELGERQGLSDAPVLKKSDAVSSPCVWGISQPVVLVPASFEGALSEAEWKLLLAHEVAHLSHQDPLKLLLSTVVCHAFWWNPLVWLGLRDAVLAQEQGIDSKVARDADLSTYRGLLLRGVAPAGAGPRLRFLGQGHLLTRVQALGTLHGRRSGLWATLSPCLLALTLIPIELLPAYHPDPSQIGFDEVVFISTRSGEIRLWRMAMDGRGQTAMASTFIGAATPSISPDGRWLAYSKTKSHLEDIYVARVDGTQERLLVSSPGRDYLPAWSPDGSKLVFCTTATGNWEVAVADVETGEWKYLTKDGKRNLEPAWHPNGERIVFSSHRTGSQKLWSMGIDGSNLVQLTTGAWEDTNGEYSSDGRHLLFASYRRGKFDVCLMDLATREVRSLTRLGLQECGEASFVGRATVMMARRGTDYVIAMVAIEDGRFRYLTSAGDNYWTATR